MSSDAHPRIYVACLAAYNSGVLHGVWIDAAQDADAIEAEIKAMLKTSPMPDAEEWEIHDSEEMAGVSGHDLEVISQVALLIQAHGTGAVEGYISHVGQGNLKAEIDNFSDIYIGCYTSESSFCEAHLGEDGGICSAAEGIQVFDGSTLDQYIDWDTIANDAFINSYFSHRESHDRLHVYLRQ